MAERNDTIAHDIHSNALEVIINAHLFHYVNSYNTGWPYALLKFAHEQQLAPANGKVEKNIPILPINVPFSSKTKEMEIDHATIKGKGKKSKKGNKMEYKPRTPYILSKLAIQLKRRTILSMLVRLNQLEYYSNVPVAECSRAMRYAIEEGDWDTFLWLYHRRNKLGPTDPMLLDAAIRKGNLEQAKWLYQNYPESCIQLGPDTLDETADGKFEMLKWAHSNQLKGFTFRAMDIAAGAGHLEIVKFLHHERDEGCSQEAMTWATGRGHMEIIQFLHTYRYEGCSRSAMASAAGNGYLQVVKFLCTHRNEGCFEWSMDCAAGNGHLKVLKYLIEMNPDGCSDGALNAAAINGHFHVVLYLLQNTTKGCLFDARQRALKMKQKKMAALLTQHMPENLTICSSHMHPRGDETRRCQRPMIINEVYNQSIENNERESMEVVERAFT